MSKINGDKGRHDRQRKAKLHNREKMRELRKTLSGSAPKSASQKTK